MFRKIHVMAVIAALAGLMLLADSTAAEAGRPNDGPFDTAEPITVDLDGPWIDAFGGNPHGGWCSDDGSSCLKWVCKLIRKRVAICERTAVTVDLDGPWFLLPLPPAGSASTRP